MTTENPIPASATKVEPEEGAIIPVPSLPDSKAIVGTGNETRIARLNPTTENRTIPMIPTALVQALADPLEPPINIVDRSPEQLPYEPFNPEANAARAAILSDSGPMSIVKKLSPRRAISELQGSRRFEQYIKQYERVLRTRKTPQEGIERFKAQAERIYKKQPTTMRAATEEEMKRNLELLIESSFDADLAAIESLKGDAGKSQEIIEGEEAGVKGEFKPARREAKINILQTLATEKEDLLISNYETYLRIWQDLNPDGVNIEALRATFENAGSDRTQQVAFAEKLYSEASHAINQRALAFAAQWKQLSIDRGLPSDMADEEAHLLATDATRGPLLERMIKMREIKAMTEELLLRTFGITSKLYAEMTTRSAETQYDLDAAFNSPHMSVENRIKLAKGLYRKIDRLLRSQSDRLFTHVAKHLRKDRPEADVTFELHRRQSLLKSLPRHDQHRRIKDGLEALGLKFEPVPITISGF